MARHSFVALCWLLAVVQLSAPALAQTKVDAPTQIKRLSYVDIRSFVNADGTLAHANDPAACNDVALATAIASVATAGGSVYLPPGEWWVCATTYIPNGVSLVGAAMQGTIISAGSSFTTGYTGAAFSRNWVLAINGSGARDSNGQATQPAVGAEASNLTVDCKNKSGCGALYKGLADSLSGYHSITSQGFTLGGIYWCGMQMGAYSNSVCGASTGSFGDGPDDNLTFHPSTSMATSSPIIMMSGELKNKGFNNISIVGLGSTPTNGYGGYIGGADIRVKNIHMENIADGIVLGGSTPYCPASGTCSGLKSFSADQVDLTAGGGSVPTTARALAIFDAEGSHFGQIGGGGSACGALQYTYGSINQCTHTGEVLSFFNTDQQMNVYTPDSYFPWTFLQAVNFNGAVTVRADVNIVGSLNVAGPITGITIGGVAYADTFPGADIAAQINTAIADFGAGCGTIRVPRGTYTFSGQINADGTNSCIIMGDGNTTSGARGATELVYTGTVTPISARSSFGFTWDGIQLVTTNPTYAATTIDLGHSGLGTDTAFAIIENSSFFSQNGGSAGVVISVDDAIVCELKNLNLQNYAIGILGASTVGHYSNGIKVDHVHFSSSTGSAVTAHIKNPGSGWAIVNPTFEMGSAAGTPKAIYCSSASIGGLGIHLSGMWLGDTSSGSQALIDICGGGWEISGGSIAGDNSTVAFNLMAGVWGVNISGLTIANHAVAFALNGNLGFHETGNVFASVTSLTSGSVGSGIVQNMSDYGQGFYGPTTLAGTADFTSSAKFSGSVSNSGIALKHMTICPSGCTVTQTPCSTSAVAGNSCVSTATWPGTAFIDTNYTAVCQAKGATSGVPIITAQSVNTSQISYQIQAATAAVATVVEVDCIGMHP